LVPVVRAEIRMVSQAPGCRSCDRSTEALPSAEDRGRPVAGVSTKEQGPRRVGRRGPARSPSV